MSFNVFYKLKQFFTKNLFKTNHAEQNLTLTVWLMLMLGIGVVFVYSSSIPIKNAGRAASEFSFLYKHIFSLVIGIGLFVLAQEIKLSTWRKLTPYLFGLSIFLLMIILVFSTHKVNGARRWISIYGFTFQPSELAKLSCILYIADYLVRKSDKVKSFKEGILPLMLVIGLVGALLLLEPDMGAFMVITLITGALLFLGGAKLRLFTLLSMLAGGIFSMVIWLSPWRKDRIFAYLDPWNEAYREGKGYQLIQSLMAFGEGGIWGQGLGGSVQKLHFLPEAQTDFISAIIAEEVGTIGIIILIALYYICVKKAFVIGRMALQFEQQFASLVAQGIGVWFGVQVFIHLGVNMGLLPTKGLTLPFISYGGSALMMNCLALGLLMRVHHENQAIMQGRSA